MRGWKVRRCVSVTHEQEAAAAMKTNDALVDSPSALWKQQAMRK